MGYQLGHLSVHDVLAHPRYIQASISYILRTYQGTYSMGRISLHTRISTNSRCNFYIRIFRILGYEHLTFILCVSISTKQGCVFQHTYTSNVKFTFTSFDIGINSYVIYTRISWISLCTKFECKFNIYIGVVFLSYRTFVEFQRYLHSMYRLV